MLSVEMYQTRNSRCKGCGAGTGLVYSQNIKDVGEGGKLSRGKGTKRYGQTGIG